MNSNQSKIAQAEIAAEERTDPPSLEPTLRDFLLRDELGELGDMLARSGDTIRGAAWRGDIAAAKEAIANARNILIETIATYREMEAAQ